MWYWPTARRSLLLRPHKVSIISLFLFWRAQSGPCLTDLYESLGGGLIVWVEVRMVRLGQLVELPGSVSALTLESSWLTRPTFLYLPEKRVPIHRAFHNGSAFHGHLFVQWRRESGATAAVPGASIVLLSVSICMTVESCLNANIGKEKEDMRRVDRLIWIDPIAPFFAQTSFIHQPLDFWPSNR